MPGPLPDPNRQRRNKPAIPTTSLPSRGRRGPVPKPPAGYDFGRRGAAWWKWAWKTPQAAAWSAGDLYVVARRAMLEDEMDVLARVDSSMDLAELLEVEPKEQLDDLKRIVCTLKALAGGSISVKKEARELDDRLGLTPKGFAALRFKIVDEDTEVDPGKVRQLRPVAPGEDPRKLLSG
jgi:hypothetical protein